MRDTENNLLLFESERKKEAWKNQAPYSLLTTAERTEHQESAEPYG